MRGVVFLGGRKLELRSEEVGYPDMANLSLRLQLPEGTQGLLERNHRVGIVELIQVDAVEAQPAQASSQAARRCFGRQSGRALPSTAVCPPFVAITRSGG